MLKCLIEDELMSATYFEMHQKIRLTDGQKDGYMENYMMKQITLKANYRISVMGLWVFTVQFFQFLYMFEHFYNKMLENG